MGSPIIAKLFAATEPTLATEKAKAKPTLPPEYSEFSSVFSEKAHDQLPPSRPYDHEMNLDESFIPKVGKGCDENLP
jgi:hypothetical protein